MAKRKYRKGDEVMYVLPKDKINPPKINKWCHRRVGKVIHCSNIGHRYYVTILYLDSIQYSFFENNVQWGKPLPNHRKEVENAQ